MAKQMRCMGCGDLILSGRYCEPCLQDLTQRQAEEQATASALQEIRKPQPQPKPHFAVALCQECGGTIEVTRKVRGGNKRHYCANCLHAHEQAARHRRYLKKTAERPKFEPQNLICLDCGSVIGQSRSGQGLQRKYCATCLLQHKKAKGFQDLAEPAQVAAAFEQGEEYPFHISDEEKKHLLIKHPELQSQWDRFEERKKRLSEAKSEGIILCAFCEQPISARKLSKRTKASRNGFCFCCRSHLFNLKRDLGYIFLLSQAGLQKSKNSKIPPGSDQGGKGVAVIS